ncbi:MAG TPA: hypothetical protein GX403_12770, partial [Rhodocyclaceae bacterium]|nr:hypothetical protein [Rhodocyclaceae bacterium]
VSARPCAVPAPAAVAEPLPPGRGHHHGIFELDETAPRMAHRRFDRQAHPCREGELGIVAGVGKARLRHQSRGFMGHEPHAVDDEMRVRLVRGRGDERQRRVGDVAPPRAVADRPARRLLHLLDEAEKIDQFLRQNDGFLCGEDLAAFHPEWVDPIGVNYRGYDVWEIPPNGQGIVALMALNILKGFEFSEQASVETYHRQIEAIKLAFADGMHMVTERKDMRYTVEAMLSDEYGAERRQLIGEEALLPTPGTPPQGGTVYLATADGEGNMVSYIQSNYQGFGSGVVVPGTGIALQNRGHNFSLDPEHVNALAPGKRTYHTIIPGFLTKGKEAVGPFGVMGGFMQPQGHLQVVMNTIDFGLNPQAALDAPRWQWTRDKVVLVEPGFPDHLAQALARKGHQVQRTLQSGSFGRGEIIWRDSKTGVLVAGTEPRTDGQVAAW